MAGLSMSGLESSMQYRRYRSLFVYWLALDLVSLRLLKCKFYIVSLWEWENVFFCLCETFMIPAVKDMAPLGPTVEYIINYYLVCSVVNFHPWFIHIPWIAIICVISRCETMSKMGTIKHPWIINDYQWTKLSQYFLPQRTLELQRPIKSETIKSSVISFNFYRCSMN